MWSHPTFLKSCETLARKRGETSFVEGMKLARGFADLGYEEFLLLPGNKLLSLYSGAVTAFPEDHRSFFFDVPTVDEMSEQILKAGWDILSLSFPQQRSWRLEIKHSSSEKFCLVEASTLELAFVKILLEIKD